LAGGDTSCSNRLSITVSVVGYSKKSPVLRSGAKVNDDIYITNTIGDAFVGLGSLKGKIKLSKKNSDYFGKSPFDDLQSVTNTVMDVMKQDRERKLAIAQATAEVSAKQQEGLKPQSEDKVVIDKKGE